MKLGFMTFIQPEWTLREHVEAAKRHGYAGIEPRAEAKHRHGVELETPAADLKAARALVEGEGLAFCCLATSRNYSKPDAAERARSVDLTKRYVELAARIGAPYVRVFGGVLPDKPGLFSVVSYMADALREVGEFAAGYPVVVCIETHDSWLSTYRMMELIRRVNHPSVQVNYDYAHPCREFEPAYESYMHLRPWVRHTHMHDLDIGENGELAFVPPFTGITPQREVMALLKTDNYAGYFSVEVMGQEADSTLAAYAREFNRLLAEV
jgi:sugar phosphate isomerase/epimerase